MANPGAIDTGNLGTEVALAPADPESFVVPTSNNPLESNALRAREIIYLGNIAQPAGASHSAFVRRWSRRGFAVLRWLFAAFRSLDLVGLTFDGATAAEGPLLDDHHSGGIAAAARQALFACTHGHAVCTPSQNEVVHGSDIGRASVLSENQLCNPRIA